MESQAPRGDEERGRVLPFKPREPRARNDNLRHDVSRLDKMRVEKTRADKTRADNARLDRRFGGRPLIDDLDKYERHPDDDNYRHRMVTNLLAFVVLGFIVYCGVWLANTMAQMRNDQDCVLTGRTNCAAIKVPNNTH